MPRPLVFISNVPQDNEYARKLVTALRREGTDVTWGYELFASGERWYNKVTKALEKANVFIALVSPDFLSSTWGMFELGAALGRRWELRDSMVVPVLLHGVRPRDLPGPLQAFQAFDSKRLGPQDISRKVLNLIREAIERSGDGPGPRHEKARGATT